MQQAVPAPDPARPNVRLLGLLSVGHMVVDMSAGSLPALLPFLKEAHGLSYAAVGALVLVANLTSSVIQPVFGFLADRRVRTWMLPLSVVCAGLGLSLAGMAPNYWAVLGLLVITGFGVAAYHPEGYKTASSVAGEKRATGISWFSVGGNAGTSLGPPFITALIASYGLKGSLGLLFPAVTAAGFLMLALPRHLVPAPKAGTRVPVAPRRRTLPAAIVLLICVVALRSWAQIGFMTFLPFYYVDYLQAGPNSAGLPLFVFLGAGALGTVIGGPLADRWGARRFMLWVFAAAAPFGLMFILTRGAVALIFLGLFGGVLVSTFTISVVLGQYYLPGNPGLASGLIVGFAIGTGGMASWLFGWIADVFGLLVVLWMAALIPLACFAAATLLPAPTSEVRHQPRACAP